MSDYNFKVRCVDDGGYSDLYTVGKVYELVDGSFYNCDLIGTFKDIDDLNSRLSAQFELVEDTPQADISVKIKTWGETWGEAIESIGDKIKPQTINKHTKHQELCKLLSDTYKAKNADYGDSFGDTYKDLGIISAITRIVDKTNRLKTLCKHDNKVDESMRDTLLDLANYAIMTVIEMEADYEK